MSRRWAHPLSRHARTPPRPIGLSCLPWSLLVALTAAMLACSCQPSPARTDKDRDGGETFIIACGDGRCDLGEDCETCPEDCGVCPRSCFDGVCQLQESCQRCPADCGTCSIPADAPSEAHADDDATEEPESAAPSGDPENDDESPESPPTDAPTSEETDPPAPSSPDPDSSLVDGWSALESDMLALVNAMRESGGSCPSGYQPAVPVLVPDAALHQAARLHAIDMGERAYFAHDTPEGVDPWQRIGEAGYTGSPTGENIAAGNNTAEATFHQWQNSDGHCRNMMSANSGEIGIGHAQVEGSPYGHYWVQNFGRR